MRDRYFVDTVCWIGLLNKDDELHELADKEYKHLMKSGVRLITTTAVLNEVANALSNPGFRSAVVEFHNCLRLSSRVDIIFIDQELWSSGWKLYEERSDKAWSLTDCFSIVVIEREGLKKVLTNDRHFEQAGFQAVLRKEK